MTIITERVCKLGLSINSRTERHGDEGVPAIDIPLVGILLQKAEVNELCGDLTWESLFNTQGEGKAPQVLHPKFAARKWTEKYEGAVTIVMGPNEQTIQLDAIKLAKLRFEPLEGGLVSLSLSIQVSEKVERFVHKLIARQDTEVRAEIEFGDRVERKKAKQPELPMDHTDGAVEDDDGAASQVQADALANSKPGKKARGVVKH